MAIQAAAGAEADVAEISEDQSHVCMAGLEGAGPILPLSPIPQQGMRIGVGCAVGISLTHEELR